MRQIVGSIVLVTWAMWLGSVVAIAIFIQALFVAMPHDKSLAGDVAAGIFAMFGRYQLIAACVAVVAAFAWRIRVGSSRTLMLLFVLLMIASGGAAAFSGMMTPQLNRMRANGESQTPQFRRLHGLSMVTGAGEAAVLLAIGFVLPSALRQGDQKVGK